MSGVNRQGQAHIVSTAIQSPRSRKGVEATPWFRTWFSIDPQPASISPTINISIVFICAFLVDYGRSIRHRRSKAILARSLGAGRSRTVSADDDSRRKFRNVIGSRQRGFKRIVSRDFSDEKEIHSTPTSSREHANTVGDRFRQRVRSYWFGELFRRRARTSCHTGSGFDRNACANSHPVSNFCAGPRPSAPV